MSIRFKYRVMVCTPKAEWELFDDVLDEINACAIADEAIDGWHINEQPIVKAIVIDKATRKCIHIASR